MTTGSRKTTRESLLSMAGQMEVVGGGPSSLVLRHETAPTTARSSAAGAVAFSMDADPYFVQPAPVPQMQIQMQQRQQRQQQQYVRQQAQQQAQWRSSSTPIECTASGSLTVQWQASTADRLFKALQTMFTTVPARGVKRAVLQDWNCADSPSLKRFRFEGESYAAQGSNPEPADFARDLSPHATALQCIQTGLLLTTTHTLEPRLGQIEVWSVGGHGVCAAGAAPAAGAALRLHAEQARAGSLPGRRGRAQGHAALPAQPTALPPEQRAAAAAGVLSRAAASGALSPATRRRRVSRRWDVAQQGQSTPWQCPRSAPAMRLLRGRLAALAGSALPGERPAGPLGARPLPRLLELAASQAAHFTAFDRVGDAARRVLEASAPLGPRPRGCMHVHDIYITRAAWLA